MLTVDSVVIDIMFATGAQPDPELLIEKLGGEEAAGAMTILDPDMQDPRFEMMLGSPSRPFRRRGEMRILIINGENAPMREDPMADPIVPVDLRPAKEILLGLCESLDGVRFGRVFALGTPVAAVMAAKSARDLRGICLLGWLLDPQIDLQGRQRASQLSSAELEEKVLSYDKRLEELNETQIIENLRPAKLERRGDWLVVDALEADGTWDVRNSFATEDSLCAIDQFSLLPGAPQGPRSKEEPKSPKPPGGPPATVAPVPVAVAEPSGSALTTAAVGDRLFVLFPEDRFDLNVAAQLGKGDWESVLSARDSLDGKTRDRVLSGDVFFVAPLEFLSEVFVDGKPLNKADFAGNADRDEDGTRSLEVHCPRFGPVLLVEHDGKRYISSERGSARAVVAAVSGD